MIGGTNPIYSDNYGTMKTKGPQDPWDQGIAVFDMTALKFQDSYRSRADLYESPYFIQQYYNNRWAYNNRLKTF